MIMGEKVASGASGPEVNELLSKPAHSLPYDLVVEELGSKIDEGLSNDEAARRLQQYGPNKLEDGEGISILRILVAQVANAMMLVKPTTSLYLQKNTRI
jgi:magnesium-transporting ATPase (P-type)